MRPQDLAARGLSLIALEVGRQRSVGRASFIDAALAALTDAERLVVRAIRAHLAEIDPPVIDPAPEPASLTHPAAGPAELLRALLDTSMYARPQDSRTALYVALIGDLLPDEARILAALSDGTVYPVIDIAEPILGTSTAFVLTNASTVGRAAGVSLPEQTPLYLGRLIRAGLARLGPEGTNGMRDDYEMLLTDSAVNAAIARGRRGVRSARVIRRTIRITELGHDLWTAAT